MAKSLEDQKIDRARIQKLYFEGLQGEKVFDLWESFDPELALDLTHFVSGTLYAREKIPHTTRQLTVIAALTAMEKTEELRVHIWGAINVGCTPEEIAEVIFQMFTYAGAPAVNSGLKALRAVMDERGLQMAHTQEQD
ncbi:MAG: carboxymuconolactone decarboxylase family protein [Alphaproteobacteria bacterium]|nr:carboxymuconolactone decarboxylase family protein [Alphaproteobacteria bacterium]